MNKDTQIKEMDMLVQIGREMYPKKTIRIINKEYKTIIESTTWNQIREDANLYSAKLLQEDLMKDLEVVTVMIK